MFRNLCPVACLAVVALTGCTAPHPPPQFRQRPETKLVAFVVEGQMANSYRLVNLADVTVGRRPVIQDVPGGKRIRTRHIIKLSIINEDEGQDFDVFFGPYPGSDLEVSGHVKQSRVSFVVDDGWGYLTGDDPDGETDWVAAGAEGSTLLFQIVNLVLTPDDDHVHRVFFLSGSKAWARTKAAELTDWTTSGEYIEVDANGAIVGPKKIATADQKIQDFVQMVREIAAATP